MEAQALADARALLPTYGATVYSMTPRSRRRMVAKHYAAKQVLCPRAPPGCVGAPPVAAASLRRAAPAAPAAPVAPPPPPVADPEGVSPSLGRPARTRCCRTPWRRKRARARRAGPAGQCREPPRPDYLTSY